MQNGGNSQWPQDWPLAPTNTPGEVPTARRGWGRAAASHPALPVRRWGGSPTGHSWSHSALHFPSGSSEDVTNTPGGISCSPPKRLCKTPCRMISYCVTPAALGCHLPAKAQLSLNSGSFSPKMGFYPNKGARIEGRWMGEISRGKLLTPHTKCCFSGQDREQPTPSVGCRQHQNPKGHLLLGQTSLERWNGKTSISWTGGTNKSFMKRIGNIIARAKRMLICFATWSNGMTGLEGCSHFGGWLLQLIQSINFAALLQAELVPSDLKLSMHLFYQKICVCVCVWDCLINEFLFNINMQKSLLPQRCVNIYIFLGKEACLWLF